VAAAFQFEHSLSFTPDRAVEILRTIPALPGIFALRGAEESAQPYLTRAANLQRRMQRLLSPPDARRSESDADGKPLLSNRLNLSARVAHIDYTITGSEFESLLVIYRASAAIFGLDEARRRLKLRTPYFLRFAAENAFPRIYTTNKLAKRSLAHTYGPFPSRAAADRYCEAVEDLFLIRRCHEELHPAADHPGCIYGEMGKCLAPCNRAQIPAEAAAYSAEAASVEAFLNTRGESLLTQLTAEREQASTDLNFERAAEVHAQIQKVKAAIALADELVAPIPQLRAIIVQKAAHGATKDHPNHDSVIPSEDATVQVASQSRDLQLDAPIAALFLLSSGCLFGPAQLSTLGVRAVREQTAVGSSLFAQPLMLEAVPLAEDGAPQPTPTPVESPEARATAAIVTLEPQAGAPHASDLATLSDHLSLLRRWYYRPEKQRAGEIFFPREDGSWPVRRILRAAARAALGEPTLMPHIRRDLAQKNPEA